MHHYGEDSTYVDESANAFHIEFKNKVSGAIITMRIPKEGSLESNSEMTRSMADLVGNEIAHLLRNLLNDSAAVSA
jgi:hypothetical protein